MSVKRKALSIKLKKDFIFSLKKREKIICQKEYRYKVLFDSSRDAIMILYPGKNFLEGNKATIKMFKCADEKDFISRTPANFSPKYQPDGQTSNKKAKEMMKIAMEKGSHFFEWKHKRLDGEEFDASVLLTRIKINDYKLLLATVRDISKHKEIESEIKLFRDLMDNAKDSLFIVNPESSLFLDANKTAENLLGLSRKQLLNKKVINVAMNVQNILKWKQLVKKIKSTDTFVKESSYKLPNGNVVFVEVTFKYINKNVNINLKQNYIVATVRDITERKKTEVILQEKTDRFQAIANTMADFIWEVDLKGKYTYCSEKVITVLGYSYNEMLGKTPFDFIVKEEKKDVIKIFNKVCKTKQPIKNLENWNLTKDKKRVCLRTSAAPIVDPKGKLVGYRGVDADITEQKKAEEKLKLFRDLLDSANDILLIVDPKTADILNVNKVSGKILGFRKDELLSKKVIDIDGTVSTMKEWRKISSKIDRKGYLLFETYVRSKAGKFLPMEVSVKNVMRGKKYMVATLRDISDRKKATKDLENIFNLSPYMLCVSDIKGRLKKVSPAFTKILGYSQEDLLKKPYLDFVHPDDIEITKEVMIKMKKEEVLNFENRYRTKNGSYKWLAWSASPYLPGGISFAIAYDVSKRKEVEQRIVEKQKEVKNKNKELIKNEKTLHGMLETLRKTHKELQGAQAQLVQSEKLALLGQLAAGIAHEINNPIGFINSNIETLGHYVDAYSEILYNLNLLKKSVDSKDLKKSKSIVSNINMLEEKLNLSFIVQDIYDLLKESKRGTERIQNIVKDLSVFARKDKGDFALNNIEDILDGVINILGHEFKYKGKLIKTYDKIPLVYCNAQRIGQVFLNLLANAAQALKIKGDIKVKTYEQDKNAFIQIIDTGEGIASENLEKIFEPFFTTKEVGKGTGLGMSISSDIIKEHKGNIKVQSKLNKGTTVTVRIPYQKIKVKR